MIVAIRTIVLISALTSGALLLAATDSVFGAEAPGDIQFERQAGEGKEAAFPPAIFQHWLHRVRYRCDACHDSLFEMKRGATPVTMELIAEGEACGACHNGIRAFDDSFQNCSRCHRQPAD